MKKIVLYPLSALLGVAFIGCFSTQNSTPNKMSEGKRLPTNNSEAACPPMKYKKIGETAQALTEAASNSKSGECQIETPSGLYGKDLADFEHLSEGADVYPYEWFMSLKSLVFPEDTKEIYGKDIKNKYQGYFVEHMDKKFGILPTQTKDSERVVNGEPRKVRYLMNHNGLTASWSNRKYDDKEANKDNDVTKYADAFESYENANGQMITESQVIKSIDGLKSIRMVGTNCALCHSGAIEVNNKVIPVEGTPSMVNVRGFFKDLAASTMMTMLDDTKLEAFLKDIKTKNPSLSHIDPKKDAKRISSAFEIDFANKTRNGDKDSVLEKTFTFFTEHLYITKKISKLRTLKQAKDGDNHRLFHGIGAIRTALIDLLKTTYNLTDEEVNKSHLYARMDYFAKLSVGIDPDTTETISGFNRTDAFGRIGNLVLRGSNPVDITAPVSLPWVWGLKYMGNLHYNGNSNSVVMRNVGQSLGLGAIILDKELNSTVNLHNLDKIEHLIHKVRVPEWNVVFKSYQNEARFQIKEDQLQAGYQIYTQSCAKCHESNLFAGPSMVLRQYKMFPLQGDNKNYNHNDPEAYMKLSPNTDKYAAENPVKPIVKDPVLKQLIPFQESIFNGVGAIKDKYYKVYGFTPDEMAQKEFRDIRGYEFFRDTYLGFTLDMQNSFKNNYGAIPAGTGYKARHLSGVWATGPFLHNGSVPTLWELLKPSAQRPKVFNVGSMKFDPEKIGAPESYWNRNNKACDKTNKFDNEICFDTARAGNSNVGHEWGTNLTDEQKKALIEFLKYLPPEPEYSWKNQSYY